MNLVDPGTLKALLGRHQLSASKGLGQHFLVSAAVVDKIVSSLEECQGVLEIGPGPGVLTGPISEQSQRMIAIEIDERMPPVLAESAPKAEVRQLDALQVDLRTILSELPEPRGLVSNLPYYITGPLLAKIAESRTHFSKAVLMMQKEVGERVLAPERTPARGSLSVFLQCQFTIRRVAVAPAGAFLPPPKVDSVVLEFVPLALQDSPEYFRLVRQGFVQPRKTLANNLVAASMPREAVERCLVDAGFKDKIRPQELSNEQWRNLYEILKSAKIIH